MTSACLFALREAVTFARQDAGTTDWFEFGTLRAPGGTLM